MQCCSWVHFSGPRAVCVGLLLPAEVAAVAQGSVPCGQWLLFRPLPGAAVGCSMRCSGCSWGWSWCINTWDILVNVGAGVGVKWLLRVNSLEDGWDEVTFSTVTSVMCPWLP